jgi:hypothetical protein
MAEQGLPRLAYIGDVGICDRGNGPRILKTLLEAYPAEKLSIHISDFWVWPHDDRLPGVAYERFCIRWQRLKMGRLYGWMTTQCLLASRKRAWALARALRPFEPQGIFTVTAGSSWLLAAHTARLLNIPLHLILHDDLRTGCAIAPGFDKWLERQFHDVYVQASSRLCVSPYMEECYRGRFGIPGTVLYPNRSSDDETNISPLSQRTGKQFTVAYAGNISSKHYVAVLARLTNALRAVNGRLLIYALTDKNAPHLAMLEQPDVEIRDRVSSHELRQRLAGDADVLFVPMSFAGADEMNMRISFPSKLSDYTGLGLPVLILGPRYCAAVRWANAFRDAAIAIDAPDDDSGLVMALKRLAGDPEYRQRFAKGAIAAGNACFSHRQAFQVFSEAVRTGTLGESQLPPAERLAPSSRSWIATS